MSISPISSSQSPLPVAEVEVDTPSDTRAAGSPSETRVVYLGSSSSGASLPGGARGVDAHAAGDPRAGAASARPLVSASAASVGATSASQAASHEPEGLKPMKGPVLSGSDAHAFAGSDRVADGGSNVLLQMVRTSPRHDIDNPADRPSYQQDPEFNAAFKDWFSPWFHKPRRPLRDVSREGRGSVDPDEEDESDEDEWKDEARAQGWTEPQDEAEHDDAFEILENEWTVPDTALYRRIVTRLMAEKFQLHVVPHVLNELRRLRRVILVTPVHRARVGIVEAYVDVLTPTRHGGSALRLLGQIEWTVDPKVAGWMLLHVFKAQTSGGAMRFHPVSSTPHTTRLLVAAAGQPFAESGQAHARVLLSDATRLRRALHAQWSLRMALAPEPLEPSSSSAQAQEAPKGNHAS